MSYSLNSENKVKILNLKVYYTTRRIIKYKKKLINPKKVKIKKNKFKNNNSTLLLKLLMEKAKQHLIILKITPINFGINKRMAKEIFKGM